MSLVTVQRSPSQSLSDEEELEESLETHGSSKKRSQDPLDKFKKVLQSIRFITRIRFSENYFAVKGAALILPRADICRRRPSSISSDTNVGAEGADDIQSHLQAMFVVLRKHDTLRVAVKLECAQSGVARYLVVVSCPGRQDTEESSILGMDVDEEKEIATVGLVFPVWADTAIELDGDGGIKLASTGGLQYLLKPVTMQAMWSALQQLLKARDLARRYRYLPTGLTHTWVSFYEAKLRAAAVGKRSSLYDWTMRDSLASTQNLPTSVSAASLGGDVESDEEATMQMLRGKLKQVMLVEDLDSATSKYILDKLEERVGMNLKPYKSFLLDEILIIFQQLDSATEIFDYLYLGSEWNASNYNELKENKVGYILNVTKEIDNFFPGMFKYMNVREYDVEATDLMKYWEHTYQFIANARKEGSRVFVHCKMGVSRSAATVMAYAMKEYNWSLEEAYSHVKTRRSVVQPNDSFERQLHTYEGIRNASDKRYCELWRTKEEELIQGEGEKEEKPTVTKRPSVRKSQLEESSDPNCDNHTEASVASSDRVPTWADRTAQYILSVDNSSVVLSLSNPLSSTVPGKSSESSSLSQPHSASQLPRQNLSEPLGIPIEHESISHCTSSKSSCLTDTPAKTYAQAQASSTPARHTSTGGVFDIQLGANSITSSVNISSSRHSESKSVRQASLPSYSPSDRVVIPPVAAPVLIIEKTNNKPSDIEALKLELEHETSSNVEQSKRNIKTTAEPVAQKTQPVRLRRLGRQKSSHHHTGSRHHSISATASKSCPSTPTGSRRFLNAALCQDSSQYDNLSTECIPSKTDCPQPSGEQKKYESLIPFSSSSRSVENTAKDVASDPLHHYEREDIPWSLGRVRKQKLLIEDSRVASAPSLTGFTTSSSKECGAEATAACAVTAGTSSGAGAKPTTDSSTRSNTITALPDAGGSKVSVNPEPAFFYLLSVDCEGGGAAVDDAKPGVDEEGKSLGQELHQAAVAALSPMIEPGTVQKVLKEFEDKLTSSKISRSASLRARRVVRPVVERRSASVRVRTLKVRKTILPHPNVSPSIGHEDSMMPLNSGKMSLAGRRHYKGTAKSNTRVSFEEPDMCRSSPGHSCLDTESSTVKSMSSLNSATSSEDSFPVKTLVGRFETAVTVQNQALVTTSVTEHCDKSHTLPGVCEPSRLEQVDSNLQDLSGGRPCIYEQPYWKIKQGMCRPSSDLGRITAITDVKLEGSENG